jgi:hypothetical protein
VVSGSKAQYKGEGTINGHGQYGFILSAQDGVLASTPNQDYFRIKIWNKITGSMVYDNQAGDDDNSPLTTLLTSGNIAIVANKKTGTVNRMDVVEEVNRPSALLIDVLSNPSRNNFTLKFRGVSGEPLQVRVTDVAGRVIEWKTSMDPNSSYSFGAKYQKGVYYVEIVQGGERQIRRLIRQ